MEHRDKFSEVLYDFDTASGGVEPAIAALAKRYPERSFDLVTSYDVDERSTRFQWKNGQTVDAP